MERTKRDRYSVKKVYIVICKACNEDIGRPVSGEDVTTREEAGELIDAHEEVFHPDDEEEIGGLSRHSRFIAFPGAPLSPTRQSLETPRHP